MGTLRCSLELAIYLSLTSKAFQADRVYAAYPGYSGVRPPVQFWHGTAYVASCCPIQSSSSRILSDTTLYPQNFWEEIKQWTQVFGVSQTPTSNITNNPQAGYSRATFGPNVQGILAQGVGHTGARSVPSDFHSRSYSCLFFDDTYHQSPNTRRTRSPGLESSVALSGQAETPRVPPR